MQHELSSHLVPFVVHVLHTIAVHSTFLEVS